MDTGQTSVSAIAMHLLCTPDGIGRHLEPTLNFVLLALDPEQHAPPVLCWCFTQKSAGSTTSRCMQRSHYTLIWFRTESTTRSTHEIAS